MYPVYSESYGFRFADGVDAHTCSSGTYSETGSPPGTPVHQLRVSSEVMMYVRLTPRPGVPGLLDLGEREYRLAPRILSGGPQQRGPSGVGALEPVPAQPGLGV